MTLGGWIIMLASTLSVTALFIWCIVKVLRSPTDDHPIHGFEIDLPGKDPPGH